MSGGLGILLIASLVLQIFMIIDAVKKRRIIWVIFIGIGIFMGSLGISALFYLFMYYLPERRMRKEFAMDMQNKQMKEPKEDPIIQLRKNLEHTDTIANKQKLAHSLMKRKQYAEAVGLYERCLVSFYKDEPDMILDLARAYYYNGQYDKCRDRLLEIKHNAPKYKNDQVPFMLAICYEKMNEKENAVKVYETFSSNFPGEEPSYRYGMLLTDLGLSEKAIQIFTEITARAKEYPLHYRTINKQWIDGAQKKLKEQQNTETKVG